MKIAKILEILEILFLISLRRQNNKIQLLPEKFQYVLRQLHMISCRKRLESFQACQEDIDLHSSNLHLTQSKFNFLHRLGSDVQISLPGTDYRSSLHHRNP